MIRDPGDDMLAGNEFPTRYNRAPEYQTIAIDRDVAVSMRDGVNVVVDVYRPDAPGEFPVLLAFAAHSKEIQGTEYPKTFPPQPAWSTLWVGHMEAGDTRFFVSRGYIHVIGSPRGTGKSGDGGSRLWDSYDLIQWIAEQRWCDGNIGMVGIGAFAAEQFHAAKQRPPHLKAIFPYDPRGAYGTFGGFREEYPGGVMHAFRYLQDHFSGAHGTKGGPTDLLAGARPAVAGRRYGQSRLSNVSAPFPFARLQGPAYAAGLRYAGSTLTTTRNSRRRPNVRSPRSTFPSILAPAGTDTPTKSTSVARKTIFVFSHRRRNWS